MSIRCINRNIDEVKNIANITGLNDSVIATMIGAWQENNNTEKFPTAQELGFEVNDVTVINKKIIPELDNKLINILDKLGVDVRVHDSLVYNGKDINGSFDTLSKIVDISLNRNLDTLSEETAHAVVSYLKASRNPLYSSMMSDISKFSIYQEVYNMAFAAGEAGSAKPGYYTKKDSSEYEKKCEANYNAQIDRGYSDGLISRAAQESAEESIKESDAALNAQSTSSTNQVTISYDGNLSNERKANIVMLLRFEKEALVSSQTTLTDAPVKQL